MIRLILTFFFYFSKSSTDHVYTKCISLHIHMIMDGCLSPNDPSETLVIILTRRRQRLLYPGTSV